MKTASTLIALAALWIGSSVPALAQHGPGRGPVGHPAGGPPSIGSGPRSGPRASATHRPEMDQRRRDRPVTHPQDRVRRSSRKTLGEHLAQNPKLSAQLAEFFPPGTDLPQQTVGFRSLGEFVAAAHVSHNLGIPLDQLKARMVNGRSLGEAIHDLKPDVDHTAEESKARAQARKVLRETEPKP